MCRREAIVDGSRGRDTERDVLSRDVRVGGVHLPRERTVPRSARTTRGDLHRRDDAGVASASRSATFSPWIPILVARRHAPRVDQCPRVTSGCFVSGVTQRPLLTANCGVLRASGPIEAVFSLLSGSFHPRRAQCDARASGASSRRARWRFARLPSVIARARSMAPRDALRRWIGAPTGAPPVVSETAQPRRV